jgi:hypothetical protein
VEDILTLLHVHKEKTLHSFKMINLTLLLMRKCVQSEVSPINFFLNIVVHTHEIFRLRFFHYSSQSKRSSFSIISLC